MDNLYVFAIGGSGERVMYSLVMMLAAGMKIDATKVFPIFVDNDAESPAYTKTVDLIKYYNKRSTNDDAHIGAHVMASEAGNENISFFSADIADPINMVLSGSNISNLRGYTTTNDLQIKDRLDLEKKILFSNSELDMPLSAGFIGHPNIGSVILDGQQFQGKQFTGIMDKIGENDGVIVIGSLFGGTGAAGIPLIINNLNHRGKQSQSGVIALLPYFKTGEEGEHGTEYEVHTDEFDLKTRAALMYYDEHMRDVDFMYYVGDRDHPATYIHSIGGNGDGTVGNVPQDNPSHPIEVMAALSVIDFARSTKGNSIQYKIPIWSFDRDEVNNSNLSDIPLQELRYALVKFQMMKNLFTSSALLADDIDEDRAHVKDLEVKQDLIIAVTTDSEQQINAYPNSWGINNIFKVWDTWIDELEDKGGNCGSKRRMCLFNRQGEVTEDSFSKVFFTDNTNGYGVAREVITKPRIPYPGRKSSINAMDSNIKNYLHEGFLELSKKGVLSGNDGLEETKRLPYLIREISFALDLMLKERCSL